MENCGRPPGDERLIILLDLDCFFCQVEQLANPQLKGKPCAVVQQYNLRGGPLISVNYEARAAGVNKGHCAAEARKICPSIHLFTVPAHRGKSDISKYREASVRFFDILKRFCSVVERASIDEAYLDVTQECNEMLSAETRIDLTSTVVEGFPSVQTWLEASSSLDSKRLAVAALLSERIRLTVLDETGFECSAGISNNKMLAKLACTLHKPNRQTILPLSIAPTILRDIEIFRLRNFGGRLGAEVSARFQVKTIGELSIVPRSRLVAELGEKFGNRAADMALGIDPEPVQNRQVVASFGCGKNFRGADALTSRSSIKNWLQQMSDELEDRLKRDKEQNGRVAQLLTVGVLFKGDTNDSVAHQSRSVRLSASAFYSAKSLFQAGYRTLCRIAGVSLQSESDVWSPPVVNLSITVSRFVKLASANNDIVAAFSKAPPKNEQPEMEFTWRDDDTASNSAFLQPERQRSNVQNEEDGEVGADDELVDEGSFSRSFEDLAQKHVSGSSVNVPVKVAADELSNTLRAVLAQTKESVEEESFFKRKMQEREAAAAAAAKAKSDVVTIEILDDDEGTRPSTSAKLSKVGKGKSAPIHSSSVKSKPKSGYYSTVDPRAIDLELLRQMPPEIQAEYMAYSSQLGLDLGRTPPSPPKRKNEPTAPVPANKKQKKPVPKGGKTKPGTTKLATATTSTFRIEDFFR